MCRELSRDNKVKKEKCAESVKRGRNRMESVPSDGTWVPGVKTYHKRTANTAPMQRNGMQRDAMQREHNTAHSNSAQQLSHIHMSEPTRPDGHM